LDAEACTVTVFAMFTAFVDIMFCPGFLGHFIRPSVCSSLEPDFLQIIDSVFVKYLKDLAFLRQESV